MRKAHLKYLVCPNCQEALVLSSGFDQEEILEGRLDCHHCRRFFPIRGGLPRFVERHYTDNFSWEWQQHWSSQYDSRTGLKISEKRFFEETKWPKELKGEIILEAGCGGGRFTEQAIKTGALVVSFDASLAVDANYAANGQNKNLLIVQADIFQMPFRKKSFDRLFCFGVLQHTPQPRQTFYKLLEYLKPGGFISADVYRRFHPLKQLLFTRYWPRPITGRMRPEKLYGLCSTWVNLMWPVAKFVHYHLPHGKRINDIILLMPDFFERYSLTSEQLKKEWTLLHLFDWLSPRYDNPQKISTVQEWCRQAGLKQWQVNYGYGNIEIRGQMP